MKKKLSIVTLLTIVMTMCFGMTAFASPKTMPDGTVFDAEYYAKTYPDVTAVFGTDENALYQHYVTMGKAEGRHPVASAQTTTPDISASSALDHVLTEIQNRIATNTIPKTSDASVNGKPNFDWSTILKFHTDEDVESYMTPIINMCAKNGYKYRVTVNPNATYGSKGPDYGTSLYASGTSEYTKSYVIFLSNTRTSTRTDYYDCNGEDVIAISITQYTKNRTTPAEYILGYFVPAESYTKGDAELNMHYAGYLMNKHSTTRSYDPDRPIIYNSDYVIVGETPVE